MVRPGPLLCGATGGDPLTITLTRYTLTCVTTAAIPMTASDRFYLWCGVSMTAGPGNQSTYAELDVEGALDGNYDSTVNVPLPVSAPQITGIAPGAGEIGVSVTIGGTAFGASQGASTVTFNGTTAVPTAWSDVSITVQVPIGATTGPVVVTVEGVASNGYSFTVVAGTVSGAVGRAHDGAFFRGVLVEALQSGQSLLSATSTAGGAYTLGGLPAGTYDIRATLHGYSAVTSSGVTVTTGANTAVNLSLVPAAPHSICLRRQRAAQRRARPHFR